jgi:phytoene/squalene synthetase
MALISPILRILKPPSDSSRTSLAASITRAASLQTALTIRFLVDRERRPEAFRAYAYFRWLDDQLDRNALDRTEPRALVRGQWALVERCYLGEEPSGLSDQEMLLVELIRSDRQPDSGLQTYIRRMMAIMAFDAERRGRLISGVELAGYTHNLAAAVTEAFHHFIGNADDPPHGRSRYAAASGAHILHMLRDAHEDLEAGYFNIPREYLEAHGIGPADTAHDAYRSWVKARIELARACFESGREYLARVRTRRCRAAGHAYMARFIGVMEAIEQEDYRLCPALADCKGWKFSLRTGLSLLSGAFLSS